MVAPISEPARTSATAPTTAPEILHTAGFRSLGSETKADRLSLRGSLPEWLEGSLIRTGPAKFEVGEQPMRHWFDGLAMLHGFTLAGGMVSYRSRFLQSRAYQAARDRREITYSEFATDPCRSIFQRVSAAFLPKISDNANVNVTQLGDRFIAMTETPMAIEFDAETLETAGVAYAAPGTLTTAHPHRDRATEGMLNYAAKLGPRNRYRFFLLGSDAVTPKVVAQIPVSRPAYVHSFGLTERSMVLAEFPFVVNPLNIALSGRPYIENYRWKPELGTRFTLVDRATGDALGPFETDPCFAFHHVNSYEDGDEVVADICVYKDADIVGGLYLDRLRAGEPVPEAEFRRFRISRRTGKVSHERVVTQGFELPRINYERCNERSYRYAWGVALGDSGWWERIVRADLDERTTSAWSEDGCYPGEPVFVAAPDAADEDEGVLLSVVLDACRETSFLLVLDARTLDELARATVPCRIPYGFHGQFARA